MKLVQEARMINSELALPSDRVMLYYGDTRDANIQAENPRWSRRCVNY